MQVASMHFKERAHVKLHDERLQHNLQKIKGKFVAKRRESLVELDDFEGTREAGKAIRKRALDNLDVWLEIFERNATARGATVLFARDAGRHQRAGARDRRAARACARSSSRSRWSPRSRALDHAIEAAGLTVVETDLGEYILQINDYEPPSHIIGPALHKSQGGGRRALPRASTARRARPASRSSASRRAACCAQHYLTADMGISGGNFFVAETGSVVLVTNEGNATLTTTLPKVHVAISGIEKIVPTLEDVATLMRLLPRSATGQSISNYVDVLTGPKGAGEFHGAEHMYFIIVDSGRTDGARQRRARGAALHPLRRLHEPLPRLPERRRPFVRLGLSGADRLDPDADVRRPRERAGPAAASTMCNQCGVVCPVKIPLPDLQRKLREQAFERGPAAVVRARRPRGCGRGSRSARRSTRWRRRIGVRVLQGDGRPRRADPQAAARRRLDRRPRHAGAGGPDVPRAVRGAAATGARE